MNAITELETAALTSMSNPSESCMSTWVCVRAAEGDVWL